MEILEIVLLVLLLVSAAFIVVAVVLQKSNEDGLSGTIAGGSETFYGKVKTCVPVPISPTCSPPPVP